MIKNIITTLLFISVLIAKGQSNIVWYPQNWDWHSYRKYPNYNPGYYDGPWLKRCHDIVEDIDYTFIHGTEPKCEHICFVGSGWGASNLLTGCDIEIHTNKIVYWQPIINHSQITKQTFK